MRQARYNGYCNPHAWAAEAAAEAEAAAVAAHSGVAAVTLVAPAASSAWVDWGRAPGPRPAQDWLSVGDKDL